MTSSTLAVVDSSAWIEYVTGGPNADFFAEPIENPGRLIVPSITIHEVFRWVMRQRREDDALQTAALMMQGRVVELDAAMAILSARLGLQHKLPLADSIVLASAHAYDAILWTQDADFAGIAGIQFRPRQP